MLIIKMLLDLSLIATQFVDIILIMIKTDESTNH